MNAKVLKVIHITKAVVALHNFLMNVKKNGGSNHYCPHSFIDHEEPNGLRSGGWRQDTQKMNSTTKCWCFKKL